MYNALYYAVLSTCKAQADVTKISRARVGFQCRSHADDQSLFYSSSMA